MRGATVYAALAAAIASSSLHAAGRLAEVAIVDRETGTQLETYYRRGEYWVAGVPGARYSIRIRNRLGGRLLAVTSVDGVNVLTGETAGFDQSGYVFDPAEAYDITGWRKSDTEVAAFAFTTVPDSYASRTGRPQNVGVIGIALFRERAPIAYSPPALAPSPAESALAEAGASSRERALQGALGADVARRPFAVSPEPSLGTAHGEREVSYASRTHFERSQPQPNEVIRIRYDSVEHLVAMGIIAPPPYRPVRPNPFPESAPPHYVPDPPPG